MEKNIYVRDLCPGDTIRDVFLLAEAQRAQARNGPYWRLVLQDSSGRVDAMIWSPLSEHYDRLEPGMFAEVGGQVGSFKDKLQVKVEALALLNGESPDLGDFLPRSQTPPDELLEALEDLVLEHITHKPLKAFVRRVLKDDEIRPRLLNGMGAKVVHHAYVGGLLEHTLGVARLCMSSCDLYPRLDRQILLAGAIFHDLGKAWEMTGGPENGYTDAGQLLGHIELGLEILGPFFAKARDLEPELILHLKHLILSHHGEHEYGAPVRPKSAEAFVLHLADMMDSKLNIISGAVDQLEQTEGPAWTPYQRFLERAVFLPVPTPDTNNQRKSDSPENQCFLPLKG
ncbi:3'-5' exoribonuclease YhaM family protein [Paucidesulfovibrio longus]|uniref:3'-5' exoribonuclease YhaM family protein n=1 Tax=Paucidesulfovibrio longus TaxID=889 RepID=UPI0003B3A64A|nr:HD domain-containing protein [Paucidesulfovibrio longus]